jgi:hypothetical protein
MQYRSKEIELPADDLYRHDSLDRKPVVEFMAEFLAGMEGPFVLALDSPWGTGKTTAVRMLVAALSSRSIPCVYFNAWKVDYASDPLVALVAALDEIRPKSSEAGGRFKQHMTSVKKLTTSVAKHGAVAVVKAATLGALDMAPAIEKVAADLAGDLTKDLVASFQKEKASLEHLRADLEKAIAELSRDAGAKSLVFFIDELDRCRPSFAIEMLERIKHLFDVEHLVFVLSVDKKQLEAGTAAVYGERIDASEYLRRFFDLELRLPQPDAKRFATALVKRFDLDRFFAERRNQSQTRGDEDAFLSTLAELATVFQLSLRAIERVMTRLCLVAGQTPVNNFLDPILVAFLIVIRMANPRLFEQLLSGAVGSEATMEFVRSRPGGAEFVASRLGAVIECYLLAGDSNEERVKMKYAELEAIARGSPDTPEGKHAVMLKGLRPDIPPHAFHRYQFRTSSIARKVDLASTLG